MDVAFGMPDSRPAPLLATISPRPFSASTPTRTNHPAVSKSPLRKSVVKSQLPTAKMAEQPTMTLPADDTPTTPTTSVSADIDSNDPSRVKRALQSMDPGQILRDLEKSVRPRWTEVLDDWIEVDIPRSVFAEWEWKQIDNPVHFLYNDENQKLGIRCMPSAIHDSVPNVFQEQAYRERLRLGPETQGKVKIGSNTEFNGFEFRGLPPYRRKEPDAFLALKKSAFPAIIIEAGWSEKESELIKDAQLWVHGSRGSVAFVIIIIITENKVVISDGKEKFSEKEAEERCSNGERIVESIGSVVDEQAAQSPFSAQWALAREVERLDAEGNLMKPLLGEVTAKMHVFRKSRDGDKPESIKGEDGFGVEEFPVYRVAEADLFPMADDKPISLPWKEILGKDVGAGDQKKAFVLHPNEFQEGIEEAIPQRKKVCAQTRAAVILERNGELEAGPTFSELKRGVDIDDEYVPSETEGRAQKKRKTHS